MEQIREVFRNGSLSYWSKFKVKSFCEKVKEYFKCQYCAGGSSGSAVIHAAVAALEIPPGYEVISSPITDVGSLIGILYQNLIPVFADVDPYSYNITAESIRKRITNRTKAIIVVHLAGNPCEMDEIIALAQQYNIPVIEDCAQAYNGIYKGKKVGTIGNIGCFSLNESKHISCGDGGFAITNDEELYYKIHNYLDKYYDRHQRGCRMHHLAPCYRLSELQYAVAFAQLDKIDAITTARRRNAELLTDKIKHNQAIVVPKVHPHSQSSFWFYMFRVKPEKINCSLSDLVEALQAEGISAVTGYIPRPIYMEKMFAEKAFFPGGIWPAEIISSRTYDYGRGLCPTAEEVLSSSIRIPISEFYSKQDMEDMATAINKVLNVYQNKKYFGGS
ncbi:MAG: DegT/DnrJ/EryC1/StrS family aminotransferase [Victivallaceae bacterium]|nr:DegT/DnrJ/EryC1/StrS family aminotransferase [Victivallaceae bacterium]